MCMTHLAQAWDFCNGVASRDRYDRFDTEQVERGARHIALSTEAAGEQRAMLAMLAADPEIDDPESVVYYIRFSDRIKIGFSRNIGKRLMAIPHDELLTVEPGARRVEARRHQQFAEHRIKGEWFAAAPELLQHIEVLKTKHAERQQWREKACEAFDILDYTVPLRTDAEALALLAEAE